MQKDRENSLAKLGLVIYTALGVLIRYYTTFPCGSAFNSIHVIVKPYAIGFIVVGIAFGLISFIYRNKQLSRNWKSLFDVSKGAITGFSIGWGGVSLIILIFDWCS